MAQSIKRLISVGLVSSALCVGCSGGSLEPKGVSGEGQADNTLVWRYEIQGEASTSQGNGTWGSILYMNADQRDQNGSVFDLSVFKKFDPQLGSNFQADGTVLLRLNDPESGQVAYDTPVNAGDDEAVVVFDAQDWNPGNFDYTVDLYAQVKPFAGGEAWVGPIHIYGWQGPEL